MLSDSSAPRRMERKKINESLLNHFSSSTVRVFYLLLLPQQASAHSGVQRSGVHSAVEPHGGRPGVNLPDLPSGALPARPVPAGRAASLSPRPRGGGFV